MRSVPGSARSPRIATSPLTRTRPAAISASEARRLPRPARARIFCSRSGLVTRGGALGVRAAELRQPLAQVLGVGPEPMLELLDDIGSRHEVADGGQLVDAVEAQLFEERPRGAKQRGLTGTGVAADLGDVAA